jgi:F0F1-type ATP synthase assembly protein I
VYLMFAYGRQAGHLFRVVFRSATRILLVSTFLPVMCALFLLVGAVPSGSWVASVRIGGSSFSIPKCMLMRTRNVRDERR